MKCSAILFLAPSILLLTLLLFDGCASAPVTYDQRQEGEWNVQAHLENFLIILVPTGGFRIFDIGNPLLSLGNSFKSKLPHGGVGGPNGPVGIVLDQQPYDEIVPPLDDRYSESDQKKNEVSSSSSSSSSSSEDLAAKLAAGLDECKPGEVRDSAGNCKEIPKPKRRYNGQQLSQLLPALRFGLSPANR